MNNKWEPSCVAAPFLWIVIYISSLDICTKIKNNVIMYRNHEKDSGIIFWDNSEFHSFTGEI